MIEHSERIFKRPSPIVKSEVPMAASRHAPAVLENLFQRDDQPEDISGTVFLTREGVRYAILTGSFSSGVLAENIATRELVVITKTLPERTLKTAVANASTITDLKSGSELTTEWAITPLVEKIRSAKRERNDSSQKDSEVASISSQPLLSGPPAMSLEETTIPKTLEIAGTHYRIKAVLSHSPDFPVYLCESLDKKDNFVVKKKRRDLKQKYVISQQVRKLIPLGSHQLSEYAKDVNSSGDWIITRFIEGIRLRDYPFAPDYSPERIDQMIDVLKGLMEILKVINEQCGVLHADIKRGNIVIRPDGKPAILDIDLLDLLTSTSNQNDIILPGTMFTMAPEKLVKGIVHPTSDRYSLGIVAFQLLPQDVIDTALPYFCKDNADIYEMKRNGTWLPYEKMREIFNKSLESYPPEHRERMAQYHDFILAMIQDNPKDRPQTTQEALAILEGSKKQVRTQSFLDLYS